MHVVHVPLAVENHGPVSPFPFLTDMCIWFEMEVESRARWRGVGPALAHRRDASISASPSELVEAAGGSGEPQAGQTASLGWGPLHSQCSQAAPLATPGPRGPSPGFVIRGKTGSGVELEGVGNLLRRVTAGEHDFR